MVNVFAPPIRNLSYVDRWTIVPTIRKQNVAEHSYWVAMYASNLAYMLSQNDKEFQYECTIGALYHDAEEAVFGDIPTPSKQCGVFVPPNTPPEVQKPIISEEAEAIVKLADLMDGYAYTSVEEQLGNSCMGRINRTMWGKVTTQAKYTYKLISRSGRTSPLVSWDEFDMVLQEFFDQKYMIFNGKGFDV